MKPGFARKIAGVLILGWILTGLHAPTLNPQEEKNDNDWSRKLHVIVLEPGAKGAKPLEGPFEVVSLPEAELPERISHAIFPSSGGTLTMPSYVGMSDKATLLDIFTHSISNDSSGELTAGERTNEFAGLRYSVRLYNCTDEACQLELHSSCRLAKSTVTVSVSKNTTTVVHVNGAPRLSYAFTFLNRSSLLSSGIASIKDTGVIEPRPVQVPSPRYPRELGDAVEESRFSFVGIITEKGNLDRSRWILLECPHPNFARNALSTMLEKWTFVPARKAEKAIRIIAAVEVTFRLYGP